MGKKITRKVLDMLKKLADDSKNEKTEEKSEDETESDEEKGEKTTENKWNEFFKQYGKSIKLGILDDRANKAKLAKLLRFPTSVDEEMISLDTYVDRMKPKQKQIYYITGESLAAVKKSPFLERLLKRDYEVVYMIDPLDEYLMQSLTEYDGHPFMSVTKEGLKFGDDEEEKQTFKKLKEEYKDLTEWLKTSLGDKIEKVVVSNRIAKSPCVLVTGQYGWSANMERIMKAQTFANSQEAHWMMSKKTMEINPYHPIIQGLKKSIEEDATDKSLPDIANLLYDAALLVSGFQMKEPEDFASRIHRVIANELHIDPNAQPSNDIDTALENEIVENNENENSDLETEQEMNDESSHGHDEL